MRPYILTGLLLLCLGNTFAKAEEIRDVTLRYYAQWNIGERARQRLQEKYGTSRVHFDDNGQAFPNGIPIAMIARWKRLYELCMRDGCYYCDADEGSCESGTCGPKNTLCKPYLNSQGLPKCGPQCADYAFI